jgi:diguanylate cyclase (GGDEF)-like protein/PAS domain S-box-containing protein
MAGVKFFRSLIARAQAGLRTTPSGAEAAASVLQQQNALLALLEVIADAANRASEPEVALRECIALICAYGNWPIGHGVIFGRDRRTEDSTSIWQFDDPARWTEFQRVSDPFAFHAQRKGFIGTVIDEQRPLWATDLEELPQFHRREVARRTGLKSAFAFPVVAGARVIAFLEFFADRKTEPDDALLELTGSLGAQLGRVAERREAELALRESEEHFRLIVDHAGVGIIQTSLDGEITLVNDRYAEITGYSRAELASMTVAQIVSPVDYEEAMAQRSTLLRGETRVTRSEKRIRHKDGRTIWVSVSTSLVRGDKGEPRHFVSIVEGIAERKEVEAALYQSETQFRQLAENIPQMFWITDVKHRALVYLSPAFETITGRKVEEAKASPRVLVAVVHPADRRRVQKARKHAAEGGYDETFRLLHTDGSVRWVRDRGFPIRDATGRVYRVAGIAEDITERKQAEQRMVHLAHYDALTNLPNRLLCQDRLKQSLAHSKRNNWSAAVMFVDLDRFKNVNDTLGHHVGDALLQQASERLSGCVRAGDTVGRFGGDEYLVIMSDLTGPADATIVAQKISNAFAQPFLLEGKQIYITASIGIALYPADSSDQDELVRNADTAMYYAKDRGRNNFQFYQASMSASAIYKLDLENDLRRALERGEYCLNYQPKASLITGEITGFEALLRWQHPQRGVVSPAQFIPLLEETGLITDVGDWVVREACRHIKSWRDAGVTPVPVAVNLAARQFQVNELGANIVAILEEFEIEPHLLELEITESSLMHNTMQAVETLKYLQAYGLRTSIDDFGTGYSSLAYLKRFPLHALKIDRTFVRDIGEDSDDTAISLALINMAHNLGLKVIAEGVETESQLEFLAAHGCDEMQGYYFAKPLTAEESTQFLAQKRRLPRDARESAIRPKVLLVDDDEDALLLIQRTLRGENYEVLLANSGEKGLDLLSQHNIRVVVSDQQMPGMSGVAFMQRVKTSFPNTMRIMLSGHTEFETVADALNMGGIYRFVAKSWDKEELRRAIRDALTANALAPRGRLVTMKEKRPARESTAGA